MIEPLPIPDDWSVEQALAVFEILGDLRDCIWNHYGLDIQALLQEQTLTTNPHFINTDDPPF